MILMLQKAISLSYTDEEFVGHETVLGRVQISMLSSKIKTSLAVEGKPERL